jgi:tripartite-type tricarboxylate transporter receptor subunit TctC
MKLPRRRFLHLAASATALPALSRFAWAQAYPSRPVRIVVSSAAGSAPDIIARLIGQWLSERLGNPFVIENRSGGGGNIGTEAVVRASPDGYTVLLVGTQNAINATLYDKLNYNFIRDIAPVTAMMRSPNVMVVHPSVQANTVPELIAYAKANPGKLSMASAGMGTASHMAGELFKMMAGVDMVHVPYRGAGLALAEPARWTGPGHDPFHHRLDRVHQVRQASPAGGDNFDAFRGASGHSDRGRVCAGL